MSDTSSTPDITAVLGQLMQRVPPAQQLMLMALAERMAADRYRAWAADAEGERRMALLACAAREEEVAHRVEGLRPDAAVVQAEIREKNPDLGDVAQSFFAQFPIDVQFRLQAQAERLGAATWRSQAKRQADEALREIFLGCAALEEESAVVLESFRL